MHPSARLSLRLLGVFLLERGGRSIGLSYVKSRGLLAFLAAGPNRGHTRAAIAAMFWPDLPHESALTNLRQVLHDLRRALNDESSERAPLQIDRGSICLDTSDLNVDLQAFVSHTTDCPATPTRESCASCLVRMEAIADQYRGDFLAGYSLDECPEFSEWLQMRREALHLGMLALLARLADCHEQFGSVERALVFALRFQELEPWNETGVRRVIHLTALGGHRDVALARYEAWRSRVKRELGVLPSGATRSLVEQIRRGGSGSRQSVADCVTDTADLMLGAMERRQVTVLYCELMVVDDDPDVALAMMQAPQASCSDLIRRHSGYLVQVRGGSLLAYFGYPQANENAARLAVQAALAVTHNTFPGVEVRVGIHTGVVISGGDAQVPDTIGATSGLAIRLRQTIDGGQVAVSETTHGLVAGYFDCASLGQQQLQGVARPIEVFTVSGHSGARDRLESAVSLTPFIGREVELAALVAMWADVLRGSSRAVLLRGEAGIGKSRLALELRRTLGQQPHVTWELRCLPEHQLSPLFPLIDQYEQLLGFLPGDTPRQRFEKLTRYVASTHLGENPEVVPLLARMLSLPLQAPYREPAGSLQQQRERTFAIVLEGVYQLATQQPVLMLVEDLQWADPSTLELLQLFVAQQRDTAIFAVFTARNEFQPHWQGGRVRTLAVRTIDEDETAALVKAVAPDIAPAAASIIVDRADGIPLFAEELSRGVSGNASMSIPATLQDLLTARLDSLGAAKSVACCAATIGREFELSLLRRILRMSDETLQQMLARLSAAALIQQVGVSGYRFKHALIRDAAYQMQTRPEREELHRRIATELSTAHVGVRPELLAQHWAAGGRTPEAVICWIKAGKLASQNSACLEAISHYRSALNLIQTLPAGDERASISNQIEIQIGLGSAAFAAHGYASPEGGDAYLRAMVLYGESDVSAAPFPAAWGLWAGASSSAGYDHALELAKQLLRMARQSDDAVHLQQAHFAVANTMYWQGQFAGAREHLEQSRGSYKTAQHATHVVEFGEDGGVTSASYTSWVLWFLGYPDQAVQASQQALALARRLNHPFSLGYALTFAAILHCRMRQPEQALSLAQEALTLADKHDFSLWQIGATLCRGWACAMQGRSEGVDLVQQCVDMTREAMSGVTLVVLEPLAEACLLTGRYDLAIQVCDEALALGNAIGDHHIEAELYRIRGEALLGSDPGNGVEAETCFQQGLVISRRQQARSLELRIAMSLAALWLQRGQVADARPLLEGMLHASSEGLDTPDLHSARKLLNTLSGQSESLSG